MYHINSNGEPAKCRAFTDNCPFGAHNEHFGTKAEAYKGIEKEYGGSFGNPSKDLPKIGYFNREEIAAHSTNEDELMAVAQKASGKVARALSKNPAATAKVLVEACARRSVATHDYVALEMHDNYPSENMTDEGAYAYVTKMPIEKTRERTARDDCGDKFIDKAYMLESRGENDYGIKEALKNPNNKISDSVRIGLASKNREYFMAAIESNKYPPVKYIENSWEYSPRGRETIIEAARYTSNEEIAAATYKAFKGGLLEDTARDSIMKNERLSESFKETLFTE